MVKENDPLDDWNLFNQPEEETEIPEKVESFRKEYLSVTEFLDTINLELGKIQCKVLGELSDINARDRYAFFVLKESDPDLESAVVECFIGWKSFETYKHLLQDGMKVIVSGFPGIYKKSGRFRIEVFKIEPFGEGALKQAFEALKKKLEEKGYFAVEHKKQVPDIIQKIGLITSGSGAAIKDFLKNLGSYGFEIYHLNVFVEGDYAEDSIISAIRWFNRKMPDIDVIALIRGGGSLESLKAFNSEGVADAIFDSNLPVLTGIGHEKDVTIADFVADKSFSTPTAVAVFIRTQREQLITNLDLIIDQITSQAESIIDDLRNLVQSYQQNLIFCFENILRMYSFSIRHCAEKMHGCLNLVFESYRNMEQKFLTLFSDWHLTVVNMKHRMGILQEQSLNIFQTKIEQCKKKIDVADTGLKSLNPESILSRGYSIVYDKQKRVIKEAGQVKTNDEISIDLYKGKIISNVKEVSQK